MASKTVVVGGLLLMAILVQANDDLIQCCHDGRRKATIDSCGDDGDGAVTDCSKIRQLCCEQQLSNIHCRKGISSALRILDGFDNGNGDRICDQHRPDSMFGDPTAYRCCLGCQLGIRIAQKSPFTECRRFGDAIFGFNQTSTAFHHCCHHKIYLDKEKSNITAFMNDKQEIRRKKEDPQTIEQRSKAVFNENSKRYECSEGFELYQSTDDGDGDIPKCIDINECQRGLHHCHEALRCDNTIGSYHCVRIQDCGTGYTIDADTDQCEDIDECQLDIHHCGEDYRCRNTMGSFKCDRIRCPKDQILSDDGICYRNDLCSAPDLIYNPRTKSCQSRQDECRLSGNPCSITERCIKQEDDNKFRCEPYCPNGFRLNLTDMSCEDIDECQEKIDQCGLNQWCENFNGYYRCQCNVGYEHNNPNNHYQGCSDINECKRQEVIDECQKLDMVCINEPGSYRCGCGVGYRFDPKTGKCQDRDECLEDRPCQQECLNVDGGYECQCRTGFRLLANNHNCTDIDECHMAEWMSRELGQPRPECHGVCINEIGSYRCQCPSGFHLSKIDPNRCIDINECTELEQSICPIGRHCINLDGSYECSKIECPDGYHLYRTETSIRCSWTNQSPNIDHSIDTVYHRYDYLYYTLYRNQTRSINKNNTMYLYTVRMDFQSSNIIRPRFELRLLSAEWLPMEFPDLIPLDRDPLNIARIENFQLKLNRYGNEANVRINDVLDGPQKIELELIAIGYRSRLFTKILTRLTLFVSEFDRF